jgi:hypothetical protein
MAKYATKHTTKHITKHMIKHTIKYTIKHATKYATRYTLRYTTKYIKNKHTTNKHTIDTIDYLTTLNFTRHCHTKRNTFSIHSSVTALEIDKHHTYTYTYTINNYFESVIILTQFFKQVRDCITQTQLFTKQYLIDTLANANSNTFRIVTGFLYTSMYCYLNIQV